MESTLADQIAALPALNKAQLLLLWNDNFSKAPPAKLRKELARAVETEDYEKAAKIRDEISRR